MKKAPNRNRVPFGWPINFGLARNGNRHGSAFLPPPWPGTEPELPPSETDPAR